MSGFVVQKGNSDDHDSSMGYSYFFLNINTYTNSTTKTYMHSLFLKEKNLTS